MKLHSLNIQNYMGARQIDLAITQPIQLLAGKNGAGKSSIKDAIRFAMNADLCRIAKKGDAAHLVSEGAGAALVAVGVDEHTYKVTISKAGKIKDDMAGTEPHPALPYVLDPAKFAQLSDADRRALLFGLLGIKTDHKAIAERMTRKGLDAKKIEAVMSVLRSGFAAGERHATTETTAARGAWKAITGETYGSVKAEDWAPPPAEVTGDPTAKAENAEAQARAIDGQCAELSMKLGAANASKQAAQQRIAKTESLREQVAMMDRIRRQLQTAEENVSLCRAQLAGAGAEDPKAPGSYLLRGLAITLTEFVEVADDAGIDAGLTNRARAHLAEYRSLHGDPSIEPGDPARAEELRRGLATAESGAANARRYLAAAEAAAAELAELQKAEPIDVPNVADIETQLAGLKTKREDWLFDARKYREAAGDADRRVKKIADAARYHQDVQQWGAIAEALGPNGIQGEMIAEALDPLNKALAQHASLAQWQPVRIAADMLITMGGREYRLCSESEQWRADAMITVAIAGLSGLRFAVLDRMDCLDATGREDVLCWLSDLADAGQIDSVLVLATLKAAPPAEALPPHIAAHWIEGGSLVANTEPVEVAA